MRIILITILLLLVGAGCNQPEVKQETIGADEASLSITSKQKGLLLADVKKIDKVTRTKYDIEIVDTKPVDYGIEVFARVWDKDGQIGFGKDGTVDIERFVIDNPPLLVPDPTGEIIREYEVNGEIVEKRYREDFEEVLLQVIEQTMDVKIQIFDSSKIIEGKIGNTTLIAYPAAGQNAPVDGFLKNDGDASWNDSRQQTTGSDVNDTSTSLVVTVKETAARQLRRIVVGYGTSSIGADTIDSAIVSAVAISLEINDDDAQAYLNVYEAAVASESALATGDFDITNFGAASASAEAPALCDTPLFAGTGGAPDLVADSSTYNDYSLNASGVSFINTSGNTFFGILEGHDAENLSGGGAKNEYVLKSADNAGTTTDPKLVVEHSPLSVPIIKRQSVIFFD